MEKKIDPPVLHNREIAERMSKALMRAFNGKPKPVLQKYQRVIDHNESSVSTKNKP
jgi:hypothetical protein